MQISRIAQTMIGVAVVLFALQVYGSPEIAGIVTFVWIFPGLLVSPIAGALLDRHGRAKLIVIDYLVTLAALVLIGVLALAGMLPAWLLVVIAFLASFTGPLSNTGLRSLLPMMVPSTLWERVNAVDSNGYVVATIIGPPVAAALVQVFGGPEAIIVIGLLYGVAALVLIGIHDPASHVASTGRLMRDAWDGVVYTWNNRTLRGLGISLSVLNLSGGMGTIVIPLIVLDRLGQDEAMVGVMFALLGIGGMVTAFAFGRMDTRGREKALLVWPTVGMGFATALLLPDAGLLPVAISMIALGALNGPYDIGMFTIRQRRTDPAWMGRAFAVSMAFNFAGFPIGASLSGWLASVSIDAAVVMGVIACFAAAVLAWAMVPAKDDRAVSPVAAAAAEAEGDGAEVRDALMPEAVGSGAAGAVALQRLHDERAETAAEHRRPDEPDRPGA
jgi:predicted MFS family arabinose efflux permease